MTWDDIADKIILGYFIISIVIEIIDLICFFTPSTEDDKIIHSIKTFWEKTSKYFLMLSIKTPITMLFSYITIVVSTMVKYIEENKRWRK